jgi:hypothetical protein
MMEAVRTFETSVDNHFTRQYNPEDSSEHQTIYEYITILSRETLYTFQLLLWHAVVTGSTLSENILYFTVR